MSVAAIALNDYVRIRDTDYSLVTESKGLGSIYKSFTRNSKKNFFECSSVAWQ